jgi:hypothetical protein
VIIFQNVKLSTQLYYSSLLVQLKDILKEKYRRKVNKGVLFLHNNASAHWALATQKKLAHLSFQCLDDLFYSPDLAPLGYHMFRWTEKTIELCLFLSNMQVTAAMETWLDGQTSEFF